MTRTWDDVKPSKRSQFPHPLLAFAVNLGQISEANKEKHTALGKPLITLAVGDPALDGNIPPPKELAEKLDAAVHSGRANGYSMSHGSLSVRQSIAEYWTRWFAPSLPAETLSAKDVVISCGCSDGLSMVFGAIAAAGDRILLPEPFFSQYEMTANYYGIEPVYYPCLVEKNWEVDLEAVCRIMESDHEHRIRAMLINNPSNPCGSNFSRAHTEDIVRLCEQLRLPIIADEIYAGMTYDIDNPSADVPFTSVADITSSATRFVVAGASKRFGVPGERMGWILRIDPTDAGSEVMKGILNLSARLFTPMTPLQAAMEDVLRTTSDVYFSHAKELLCENAVYLHHALSKVPGLSPMKPSGGMFMSVMLKTKELEDAMDSGLAFANGLAEEENVHIFPGEAFHMPGAIRLTLSRPLPVVKAAVDRIRAFCERHARK
ncbi:putative tyrosine aminotransferase [Leptomonas seymouri]|uniref:Putative tyrosine aminotransferase n=1 Tax=Leptomonas seymouri TaxID=5684 RepID=A0A0N1I393_LEPSE|nr:putative tyrosine aminotransferase [Leptomonas seymouri]|eukprot:KPI84443.1 putative tyrosine aminotransferase [Leptomonas seymouri]